MKTCFPLITAALFTAACFAQANTITINAALDRAVVPADKANTVYLRIGLTPEFELNEADRAPVNVAIVIDKSGSMSGDRIIHAKAAAIEAVSRLGENDVLSIITYNHLAEVVHAAQRVGKNRQDIERKINAISVGGSTAIYAGVETAAKQLEEHLKQFEVNRVILLSDGQANVGPGNPSDFAELGMRLAARGMTVSSVGIGLGYYEDLMASLAESGQGNLYFVENTDSLASIFEKELGDIMQVVATNIEIEIRTVGGVTIKHVIGANEGASDRKGTVKIPHLYANGERYALVELELTGQEAEQVFEVADVVVRYRDVQTGREETRDVQISATASRDLEKINESTNVTVQRAVADQIYVEANREAVRYSDLGKTTEAVDALNRAAVQLEEVNRFSQDAEIAERNRVLSRNAQQIEENRGLSNRMRKQVVTDSYQIHNQQTRESSITGRDK